MTKPLFSKALWRIYNRPDRPLPFAYGGNLPWDDPEFSSRMLREHLTQDHGAASRKLNEIALQIDWLWQKLGLKLSDHLLDVTCGPGLYATDLATKGLTVTGIDFGPAAVRHAWDLTVERGVSDQVQIIEADVRTWDYPREKFEHAILLYGQLAVMTKEEAQSVLNGICQSLKPGGRFAVELLDQEKVDKKDSTWWYTDENRLWGDAPFMLMGERKWYPDQMLSLERYFALHLETGDLDEVVLCDQTYSTEKMTDMLETAGFREVNFYKKWDNLPLYDAHEWIIYIAEK